MLENMPQINKVFKLDNDLGKLFLSQLNQNYVDVFLSSS